MLLASILLSALSLAAEPVAVPHTNVPAEPPAMSAPPTVATGEGAVKLPKVMITEPKDGASVKTKFKVKFAVEGMKVAEAGNSTPGTGHHHLIVDGAAIPKGQAIPTDAKHFHFEKGQSETELRLAPGKHTLTLQFADGAHLSYGEMMSQTIHVTVK